MSDKKGKNRVKVVAAIVSVIFVIGVVIGATILLNKANNMLNDLTSSSSNLNSDDANEGENSGELSNSPEASGDSNVAAGDSNVEADSSENNGEGSEEIETRTSYITDALAMEAGAALVLDSDTRPQLGFTCVIPSWLKTAAELNDYNFGMIIAPLEEFESVNPANEDIDWIEALIECETDIDVSVLLDSLEPLEETTEGARYVMKCVSDYIQYENINQEYGAIAYYYEMQNGARKNWYSSFTVQDNARSVAYIASAAVADYQKANLLGKTLPFDQTKKDLLLTYIDESVDVANGELEPTYDGSTYVFKSDDMIKLSLKEGDTYQIDIGFSGISIEPKLFKHCFSVIGVSEFSEDQSIIKVDDTGKITAVGTGTAFFVALGGGTAVVLTVEVS